ncbi:MAG TPA: hypothetical protein RMH85_23185 [Polyangiaceae bacterium LLY-WYZ-15_(1-7)]|nr:hypothetical protein [Polyangiaceae bacterium LLY-WYZ-15_(1-7)]HJK99873.1 hypothetical protein [Polyangiaceae bacterium LLY-WYZ-15_(1-7)]HJL11399.1 hypothetical protein [Polyangiaceae bacterium LLY-WYZ-15_(1-7)]HJL30935.1 hypothetical protein [Polyangiaceae bacterium LLY-WYZ-15_(1-7)]HJL49199.1 hypothetical protein [Polyangiaceae bacterium LLY-WYZ-15_(1-7)]
MRPLLILLCLSMLSGSWFAQPDPELVVVADEPFVFRPSVSAELTWDSPRSPVGWGSFDLTAAPEHDEIRVDLLLGTPARDRRWTCGDLTLLIDGRREDLRTQYAGVPMSSGVYDAVTAKLTIAHVREMVSAREVEVSLCGDGLAVPAEQRRRLRDFVERFDERAIYEGPSAPSPPPELGPEHEWIFDDPQEPGGPPAPA